LQRLLLGRRNADGPSGMWLCISQSQRWTIWPLISQTLCKDCAASDSAAHNIKGLTLYVSFNGSESFRPCYPCELDFIVATLGKQADGRTNVCFSRWWTTCQAWQPRCLLWGSGNALVEKTGPSWPPCGLQSFRYTQQAPVKCMATAAPQQIGPSHYMRHHGLRPGTPCLRPQSWSGISNCLRQRGQASAVPQ